MPYPKVSVRLDNPAGEQRGSSKAGTSAAGSLDMVVYQGEKYVVRASTFKLKPGSNEYQEFEGSARIDIIGDSHSVTLMLLPQVHQK